MKLKISQISVLIMISLSTTATIQALNFKGFWEEDPTRRENLHEFLLAIRLGYLKRLVAENSYWKSSEDISQSNSGYFFKSRVGPLYEKHDFYLVPDNVTVTEVDFGDLGGVLPTTCEIIGNSMMAYGVNRKSRAIDLVVNRTIFPNEPNLMRTTITKWESKVSVVSYLIRAKKF
jgi:hypothetical protein